MLIRSWGHTCLDLATALQLLTLPDFNMPYRLTVELFSALDEDYDWPHTHKQCIGQQDGWFIIPRKTKSKSRKYLGHANSGKKRFLPSGPWSWVWPSQARKNEQGSCWLLYKESGRHLKHFFPSRYMFWCNTVVALLNMRLNNSLDARRNIKSIC